MSTVWELKKKLVEYDLFREIIESFALLSPEWRETVMFDLGGPEAVIAQTLGELPDDPEELEAIYQAVDDGLEEAIRGFLRVPEELIHAELESALKEYNIFLNSLGKFWEMTDADLGKEFKKRIRCAEGGLSLVLSEEDPLGQKTADLLRDHWSNELKMDLAKMPFVAAAALAAVTNVDEPVAIKDLREALLMNYDAILAKTTPKIIQYLEAKTNEKTPDYLGVIRQKIFEATKHPRNVIEVR